MSFPPGTEMFQFPGFALESLCVQQSSTWKAFLLRYRASRRSSASPRTTEAAHRNDPTQIEDRQINKNTSGGFPHSEIRGSKPVLGSPRLIAEYHVLHRLLSPRHPPNALIALDPVQKTEDSSFGGPPLGAVDSRCRPARDAGEATTHPARGDRGLLSPPSIRRTAAAWLPVFGPSAADRRAPPGSTSDPLGQCIGTGPCRARPARGQPRPARSSLSSRCQIHGDGEPSPKDQTNIRDADAPQGRSWWSLPGSNR